MSCSTRSNLYNYAPDCNNPIPLGVTMVSERQLEFAGTGPVRDRELEDILEEVKRAKGDHKRAAQRLVAAQGRAVTYQLTQKIAIYEYAFDGQRYRSELSCPEPTIRLTFVGDEE